MDRIVCFGAGAHAHYLWNQISELPFSIDQHIAFSDNNRELWGKTFNNIKIVSPFELEQDMADSFVITSTYETEIRKQLINEIGIPENKIYSFEEYERKCYAQWKYIKRYGDLKVNKDMLSYFDLKKIVIYTAITGEYDDLNEPSFVDDGLTYVCFTNNRNLKSDIWNIEYIQDDYLDNMHLAKKIKMYPDLYFKEFDTSVWVDGKYQIEDDIRKYIRKYEKDKPILCFPHFRRECIYDEAATCICLKIGKKEDIIKQISDYYREGFPINNGMYEMGCIVRKHNNELVKKMMDDWAKEVAQYSYRDQISFPFVCWKYDFLPDICDLDINRNQWLMQRRTLYKK